MRGNDNIKVVVVVVIVAAAAGAVTAAAVTAAATAVVDWKANAQCSDLSKSSTALTVE